MDEIVHCCNCEVRLAKTRSSGCSTTKRTMLRLSQKLKHFFLKSIPLIHAGKACFESTSCADAVAYTWSNLLKRILD